MHTFHRSAQAWLMLAVVLGASACGSNSGSSPTAPTATPSASTSTSGSSTTSSTSTSTSSTTSTPTPDPTPAPTPTPAPAPAPAVTTVVFSGVVKHQLTGRPIENALVEILSGSSSGKGVRTDAAGAFRIEGVVKGQARTQATATGFSSDTATLDFAADTTHTYEMRPAS